MTGISKGPDTVLLYGDAGYLKEARIRLSSIGSLRTSSKITGDYTGWLIELGGEGVYWQACR